MIELTKEQRQELDKPEPLAVNPETRQTYVLVPREIYARMRALLDDDLPDAGALVNEVMAKDDAKDPYLEGYQRYGEET